MGLVVIDCVPFMYYLQYLVYRQLDQPERRLSAFTKLLDYINNFENEGGHLETLLNIIAHCWELEDLPDFAWNHYQQSLQQYPRNNSAWIHLVRLFYKYFLCSTDKSDVWKTPSEPGKMCRITFCYSVRVRIVSVNIEVDTCYVCV